ncbi:uncharacterized protein ACA1_199590 [Acanthamoeba castellanii str. Neff]|uniref:Uncharacterized protein n=1 Tax=Acanthamoeba castellanii (strain ATCC 30010 / Neff) TaxID=1257118 RepID=L8H5F6_ACACF|nr:uncharacterized protein ACA1_199590 [Acanthamoeba castellanii str. Neff]ELR19676.1 hypothetical protein ACA1_199590 [Acanthamoeba castellanii str. Neff]
MEAFCQAVHAATEADCCCKDPEELHHIWDWICVVEYIALCGKNIEIEQPHSITSEVVDTFCKHPFQLKLLSNEAEETTPCQLQGEIASTKKCGKGKVFSPSTIKHKAELALQKKYLPQFTKLLTKLLGQPMQFHEWLIYMHDFTIHSVDIPLNINDAATCLLKSYGVGFYISSSPSNIANAITSLESHSTLQVFCLLHFYYSSPTYSSSMPTSEPLISGFNPQEGPPSGILWPVTPSKPFCYLHHIPIPHPTHEVVHSAPAFLTAQSSDHTALHISLYSFLIQSLELPNPSPHPITSPTTPYHILYQPNPTYFLSFCAALYSSFVCLSSTPIAEGNISSLSNWLLTFHSKFLEESDLTAITSFLQGLTSHPTLAPLTPKTSSSSSSSPQKVWKSLANVSLHSVLFLIPTKYISPFFRLMP